MLLTRRNIRLFFALLIIIGSVTALIISDNNAIKKEQTNPAPKSDIDFFITDAKFKSFDISGNLQQTANSAKVEHFKQRNYSLLQAPLIKNYKEKQQTANITSLSAKVFSNSDTITFYDNVIAQSFKNSAPQNMLKTTLLHYTQADNSIYTDKFVEITDVLGNITTATGLNSDIDLRTVNLKHNFKGTFNAKK
jgi:lipopolysaccharide export system protein LptC